MSGASSSPTGMSLDTAVSIIQPWLQEIATHTSATRNAVEGRASAGAAATKQKESDSSWLDKWGARVETTIARGIGQRLGQAQALANRGFNGTVEGARFDFAMEQVSKQLAAVMSPMLNGLTYAAVEIEKRFRRLNGAEQNGMMGAIVGGAVGLRYGGAGGAVLGAMAGSSMLGGSGVGGWERTTAGGAAGAAIGARYAGLFGAAGGAVVGGAVGASDGISGTYSDLRRAGHTRFGAGSRALFAATMDAGPTGFANWGLRMYTGMGSFSPLSGRAMVGLPPSRPGPPAPEPRQVTPFSADPLAAGGTADLIQKALIRADAGPEFVEDNPMKPIIDIGLRIIEILLAIANGSGFAVPASAVDSR